MLLKSRVLFFVSFKKPFSLNSLIVRSNSFLCLFFPVCNFLFVNFFFVSLFSFQNIIILIMNGCFLFFFFIKSKQITELEWPRLDADLTHRMQVKVIKTLLFTFLLLKIYTTQNCAEQVAQREK